MIKPPSQETDTRPYYPWRICVSACHFVNVGIIAIDRAECSYANRERKATEAL